MTENADCASPSRYKHWLVMLFGGGLLPPHLMRGSSPRLITFCGSSPGTRQTAKFRYAHDG
ncbi:MAG: hypothetical protein DSM106950_42645 [Stigonema ocellatum SAG 48.90 = DSM 106950]|nr:hypothetical protein [Stigonema ocellatum SAG 48.90 = DSM 106950]